MFSVRPVPSRVGSCCVVPVCVCVVCVCLLVFGLVYYVYVVCLYCRVYFVCFVWFGL